MGNHAAISATTFPTQGEYLNQRARVCFRYDTSHVVLGTVVRDDAEAPFRTIIRLDDGRYVLADECQYSPDYDGMLEHMRAEADIEGQKKARGSRRVVNPGSGRP